jgi:bifunctional N-acetylglucosamine-1-phosphate-uridyltransferase/glucosamine-1-phosphate-acetyltransferase GlmU-like protein
MKNVAAIILAAGKGTRMRSDLPKPLVPILEKPMLAYLTSQFRLAEVKDIFLIVGHGAGLVMQEMGDSYHYYIQRKQEGTAHAVLQCREIFPNYQHCFVFVGDSPLITAGTIDLLLAAHTTQNNDCTFLTSIFDIDLPYARVIRDEYGVLKACIEEKNCEPEQKNIREFLSSHFIFKSSVLNEYLPKIQPDPVNGEYYLTDIIELLLQDNKKVNTVSIADYRELCGLNTPEEVKWAENILRQHTFSL